ncbi:MAG TPA: hypothetical protein VHU40_19265, partial [Polyangia bacterium]|nr:hypothetical protein [Polyangia bacterium]
MRKKIWLLAIPLVAVVFAAVVVSRPARFRVQRSADPRVSPQAVYALVADPNAWQRWSPWAEGHARMTITETLPNARVTMQLELADPAHVVATSTLELKPAPNHQTVLLWSIEGTLGFAGK